MSFAVGPLVFFGIFLIESVWNMGSIGLCAPAVFVEALNFLEISVLVAVWVELELSLNSICFLPFASVLFRN